MQIELNNVSDTDIEYGLEYFEWSEYLFFYSVDKEKLWREKLDTQNRYLGNDKYLVPTLTTLFTRKGRKASFNSTDKIKSSLQL